MNPRTTGILFVVAAVLGAFVYLYEIRGGEQRDEAEARAKRLFVGLEADAIESVSLQTTDAFDFVAERRGDRWRVVEPVDFPADGANLEVIAEALASLESEAILEDPQAPEVYGLDQSARVVRFRADGAEHELRVGRKTPVGSSSYASSGASPDIVTVATFRTSGFERSLDELRDSSPLDFDRESITGIEVEWTGARVVLAKGDDGWRTVEPLEGPADGATIDTLLADLAFLQADGFVDSGAPDAETGLATPAWRVVLTGPGGDGAEPVRAELAVGSLLEDGTRSGRAAEESLYRIANERFDKLPKTVVAFRFKELARYEAADAQRFELVFRDTEAAADGTSAVVTISGTRGDSGWATEPEPMAAGAAARLVTELARLDAVDIVAEEMGPAELAGIGLDPPLAAVRIEGAAAEGGGDAPVLTELHLGTTQGDRVFARLPGRPTVYQLGYTVAEHVPVSLEAFRNRFVSKESAAPGSGGEPSGLPDAGALELP